MTYECAMAALADPTRRAILDRLRAGPLAVAELAEGLPVSRPAVSQHLKVLTAAGLLSARSEGRHRLYALSPEGVAGLRAYVDQLWDDALKAFGETAFDDAARAYRKGPDT